MKNVISDKEMSCPCGLCLCGPCSRIQLLMHQAADRDIIKDLPGYRLSTHTSTHTMICPACRHIHSVQHKLLYDPAPGPLKHCLEIFRDGKFVNARFF